MQEFKLPGSQTPIVISSIETSQCPHDVKALKEITIRMYETHKPSKDQSDVFNMEQEDIQMHETPSGDVIQSGIPTEPITPGENGDPEYNPYEGDDPYGNEGEAEWTDENGATYLLRPKRPVAGRNQPGQMITATRGSIANFKGVKNGNGSLKAKGKPAPGCIRCDATDHHWRQCPFPFQAQLPGGEKEIQVPPKERVEKELGKPGIRGITKE